MSRFLIASFCISTLFACGAPTDQLDQSSYSLSSILEFMSTFSPNTGHATPNGYAPVEGLVKYKNKKGQWRRVYNAPTLYETGKECGSASFYGRKFHGRKAATGEIFNMNKPSTACSIEILRRENGGKVKPARLVVTNQKTGRTVKYQM